MKQVLVKKGQAFIEEVAVPIIGEQEVLVHVYYSCISTGTEVSGLKRASVPMHKKLLKDPQNFRKILEMIKKQGLVETIAKVKSTVSGTQNLANPCGYSASGVVLEVGKGIRDIMPGDKVACAGAGIANHAEFIAVPRNLMVKMPRDLSFNMASTVTLGSIALQGVRRAAPKLGEFVAVIGLGILGQLISQMLKENGCKVVGVDLDQRRVDMALSLGLNKGLNPSKDNVVDEVIKFSNGYGVDSVIIAASTESSEVISEAMEMCRKKGKVVIVGAIGLNLKREKFYKKEIDVLISTSYGPGRYDERYELEGHDYPYAYVRWTENRNMQEYLGLLESGKINIEPLIEKKYSVEEAPKAYEELKTGNAKPLIVLLEYNKTAVLDRKVVVSDFKIIKDRINVALIGSGAFAKMVHLPNLKKLARFFNIYSITDKIGSTAKEVAKQYGVSCTTTDYREILSDKNVDMVIITTRHHLHAKIAIEFAESGKTVFVEKPMAINEKELQELVQVLENKKVPYMVGFNRRFSPYAVKIKEIIRSRLNPMIINYRMNVGYIPREHWTHMEEGGGRNIGEACHIYDLFNFFTESKVELISAFTIRPNTEMYVKNDNFIVTIRYEDGSVCNLIYTTLGSKDNSKEKMDIYVDGKIIHLDDYRNLKIYGAKTKVIETPKSEKGHYEELIEFAKRIKSGDGYPIPLWQLIQATEISFEVERKLAL